MTIYWDNTPIWLELINPPIPVREFDWQATLDGYEAGDLIGYGRTRQAAIIDLVEHLQEEAD